MSGGMAVRLEQLSRSEERAESWNQLLDLLFADAWNDAIGRFRSPFAFRGQPSAAADLSSGLLRLAAGRDAAALEQHLLRNFRKYAHGEVGERSIWHWLALAQHRGLPTRLVDWTYSPFVALHFATASLQHMGVDAAVWMCNFVEANALLPRRLRTLLAREGSDTATVEVLKSVHSLAEFDNLAERPFVLFLEPPSLDPRITNQFALFSLMPDAAACLDGWLAASPQLARRIIIPAGLKWEVRDKLDQLNINERVLFPGLDGLSRWLTRYYWARPGHEPLTDTRVPTATRRKLRGNARLPPRGRTRR
jgi:FRG domain-containing protein